MSKDTVQEQNEDSYSTNVEQEEEYEELMMTCRFK